MPKRRSLIGIVRTCYACGSTTTWHNKKDNYDIWYYNRDVYNNVLCLRCNNQYVTHPRFNPEYNRKWNPINHKKRITFKGKMKFIGFNPRTGQCSHCGRTVDSGEIKRTNMHHVEYDENDITANTVELCVACHNLEHSDKYDRVRESIKYAEKQLTLI